MTAEKEQRACLCACVRVCLGGGQRTPKSRSLLELRPVQGTVSMGSGHLLDLPRLHSIQHRVASVPVGWTSLLPFFRWSLPVSSSLRPCELAVVVSSAYREVK